MFLLYQFMPLGHDLMKLSMHTWGRMIAVLMVLLAFWVQERLSKFLFSLYMYYNDYLNYRSANGLSYE